MALRQREWAAKARHRLVIELGGKCAHCGTKRKLEIDCIVPQGRHHHKIEWSWRISFYREQARKGNAQVLCKTCNAIKGDRNETPYIPHCVD